MQVNRRTFSALLISTLCFLLLACQHPPGFTSDQALKIRFSQNRADLDELVRLFTSQPEKEISIDAIPDGSTTSKTIRDLLSKLHVISITRSPDEITVQVQNSFEWHYYFEYRTTVPPGLVPSLEEKTQPGKPRGIYYMQLDDNWYACVMKDE